MSNTSQAVGAGAGPSAPAVGGLRFDLLPELCLETIARHLTTGPYHPDPFLDDDRLANDYLQNNPPTGGGWFHNPGHQIPALIDDDFEDDELMLEPWDIDMGDSEEEEVEEEDGDDAAPVGAVSGGNPPFGVHGNNPFGVPVMAGNGPFAGPVVVISDSDDDDEEAEVHQAAAAAQAAAQQQQQAAAAPAGPAAAVVVAPQQDPAVAAAAAAVAAQAAAAAAAVAAQAAAAAAAERAARAAAAAARAAAVTAARADMVSFTNANKEVLRAARRAAVLARVSPMFGRLSGYLYDIKVDPAKERAFALDERNRVQWTEERNREDITPQRRQELTELLAKPPARIALANRCPVRTWSRRMVAEMKLHRVKPSFRITTTDAMECYYLTRAELDPLTCITRPNPHSAFHGPVKPPMRLYRRVDVARLARDKNPWVDETFWDADVLRREQEQRERERAAAAALAAARAPRV